MYVFGTGPKKSEKIKTTRHALHFKLIQKLCTLLRKQIETTSQLELEFSPVEMMGSRIKGDRRKHNT